MSKTIKANYEIPYNRYCVVPAEPIARRTQCKLSIACKICDVHIQQKGNEEFLGGGQAPPQSPDSQRFNFHEIIDNKGDS